MWASLFKSTFLNNGLSIGVTVATSVLLVVFAVWGNSTWKHYKELEEIKRQCEIALDAQTDKIKITENRIKENEKGIEAVIDGNLDTWTDSLQSDYKR